MTNLHRILIVDDDSAIKRSLNAILTEYYDVEMASDGIEALEVLRLARENNERLPDCILLDIMMPRMNGLDFLENFSVEGTVPIVMLTASAEVRDAVKALKLGAVDYVNKPFDVEELLHVISLAIDKSGERSVAKRESCELREKGAVASPGISVFPSDLAMAERDFGVLVGKSPAMQRLYQVIEQVAYTDATVLINGESGTGKELIAHEIHRRSKRKDCPFVALNCSAIPDTLIESELFGHEKGAFTHAIERKAGHFELADKGTIFLDEIGDLSPSMQVKILRFLQEQEFFRVGSPKPIKVDVRIIAATHKDLEAAVSKGEFREDLYYRVNVIALGVPPLRERIGDVRRLLDFFASKLAAHYEKTSPVFSEEVLTMLELYHWPGNVRELENFVESLIVLNDEAKIEASDLPAKINTHLYASKTGDRVYGNKGFKLEEAEKAFEREIILRALKQTNYVQTQASQLLGISRRILKYKMDKLGIKTSGGEE